VCGYAAENGLGAAPFWTNRARFRKGAKNVDASVLREVRLMRAGD